MTNKDALSGESPTTLKPRALETIALGTLAVGVLDFLDATLFFGVYSGAGFQRVWQGVSSGWLGAEAARAGGLQF